MKRFIYICFFIISINTFCNSEKFILVDYSYILDNYYKTKSYNKTLNKLKDTLEKKYDISFNSKSSGEKKDKALNTYKSVRTRFTSEIKNDIDIAVNFLGQTEDYDFILDKEAVLYGKGKDISKSVVTFLNDVYFRNLTIKKEKVLKSDLFPLT
ncbi:hypothetical protein [Fusobacterium sp.]|uniref:hypothetical protein n=1 Tax=Fusobacterium sp. TaxID=68766 RepID=UPI002609DDD8|nr:hypothetical protein [Fusobacterium sp.]